MGTYANSEDQDEMLQIAAFHQNLHCLLSQNQSSEKKVQHFLKIISCDPSILYTMDHPDLTVSTFTEKSIGLKRVVVVTFHMCKKYPSV